MLKDKLIFIGEKLLYTSFTGEVAFFEKKAPQKSFHMGVIKMNPCLSVAISFLVR